MSGPIVHGGSLAQARALFPGAPEPWIDLSTGINPRPYVFDPLPAESLTRLPEPEALAALEAAAAQAYGIADPACVVAAPGTQMLIELLPRLFPAETAAVLGPTYAEHAHAWAKSGARTTTVADPALLSSARTGVLCNPNNPDGRRFDPADVLALAHQQAKRGGLLVVDEAFADLEPAPLSVAPALPHPTIVVLRSFGKTYGLAGVRLGFALAHPARAQILRDALGPWAVSGPAIAIGTQALHDETWRRETAAMLTARAKALDAALAAAGLRLLGGTTLFRLGESPEAAAVFRRLGEAGIFVRRFAAHPGWLRFGQPATEEESARLRAALSAPLSTRLPGAAIRL